MRRVVNFRSMFVLALSETAVILLAYLTCVHYGLGVALTMAYYFVIVGGCIAGFFYSRAKWCFTLCLCLAVGIATDITFAVRYTTYHTVLPNNEECTVEGVADVVTERDGNLLYVVLRDVSVNDKTVQGNVRINWENDDVPADAVEIGMRVHASGRLYAVRLIDDDGVNGTAYRNDIRYAVYAAFDDATVSEGKLGMLTRLRLSTYRRLRAACGDTYGSIAYCMLTGDKSKLDTLTSRTYSMSGIGHILAVSGLHVGLITAILAVLLRLLHLPRWLRVAVIGCILVIYAVFVGCSASVLRSVIMCMIGMLTMVNGQRKDALSALSIAYVTILLFEPFLLFEVGFLLSFTAVLGLILFGDPIFNALRRIRFPRWIASSLATVTAVHIGILPIGAYFFGTVQTYSMLFNLFLIPLLSVTFLFFVLCTPVSVLFEIDVLLRIGASGFALTDMVIGLTEYLPLAQLYVCSHVGLMFIYPLYFAAGKFFMVPRHKCWVIVSAFAVSFVIVFAPTMATLQPSSAIRYSMIPVNGYGDVTTVFIDDEVTVIGDAKDMPALRETLRRHSVRKVNTLLVHRLTQSIGAGLRDFVSTMSVDRIVCAESGLTVEGLAALGSYRRFFLLQEAKLPKISEVSVKNTHMGYIYHFAKQVNVLAVGYTARYTSLPVSVLDNVPVIRSFLYANAYADRIYITNMPKGYLGEIPKYQFTLADDGDFVYKVLDGTILQSA